MIQIKKLKHLSIPLKYSMLKPDFVVVDNIACPCITNELRDETQYMQAKIDCCYIRTKIWSLKYNVVRIELLNCLFNVTINDISVIYVTAHRCAGGLKKKFDLRSGSQRHRHFVGFFNVPVQAPTRDHPFYTVIPTHRPI